MGVLAAVSVLAGRPVRPCVWSARIKLKDMGFLTDCHGWSAVPRELNVYSSAEDLAHCFLDLPHFPLSHGSDFQWFSWATYCLVLKKLRDYTPVYSGLRPSVDWSWYILVDTVPPSKISILFLTDTLRLLALLPLWFCSKHHPFLLPKVLKMTLKECKPKRIFSKSSCRGTWN